MLFTELALIRWTGSNVIYLPYFSNFVLLGSFLGIGIGFLRSRSSTQLFPWAAPALALFVVFVRTVPVQVDRTGTQLIFIGGSPTAADVADAPDRLPRGRGHHGHDRQWRHAVVRHV